MTLANELAFGVRYLVGYINRLKNSGSYQRLKKWYLLPLCPMPENKSESRGECLGPEKGAAHTLHNGSL